MTSHILLNDFKRQWSDIREDALRAVSEVGGSGWYILGKEVLTFEESLSNLLKLHVAGCANGLDAIEIGLRVLGINPGDKVLTTPLSAFATTLAIIRAGGLPVFVDIDETGSIDLKKSEELIKNEKINFFIPVHLYGHCLDLENLYRIKNKFNIRIVEDCAQAILASSGTAVAGSVGDIAACSFYPTKNLGCLGDGGAIFSTSQTLISDAKCLRDYGQTEKYVHSKLGLNSRLDEIQAAILRQAFLPKLTYFTLRRNEIASTYIDGISNPNLHIVKPKAVSQSVWHLFPILVRGDRSNFQLHLKNHGIDSGVHYPSLISEQSALSNCNFICHSVTNAKEFSKCELSLPIHPYLTEIEINRVIDACNAWRN